MSGKINEEDVFWEEYMRGIVLGIPDMTTAERNEIKELEQKILPEINEKKSTDLQSSYSDGTHKVFASVLNDVKLNIPAMLVGPTGSGKSTLLDQVAKKLNLAYYPMSVNGQTAEYHIVGYKNANGDYIRTAFRDAYEKGGLFSFEEIDAGNPNVLVTERSIRDPNIFRHSDRHPTMVERYARNIRIGIYVAVKVRFFHIL